MTCNQLYDFRLELPNTDFNTVMLKIMKVKTRLVVLISVFVDQPGNQILKSLFWLSVLAIFALPSRAEILFSDNFNTINGQLDSASLSGRRGGTLANDLRIASAIVQQNIYDEQLSMLFPNDNRSGRIRFQTGESVGPNTNKYDWASGNGANSIISAGGFTVEFKWTTISTNTPTWISFNVGFHYANAQPEMRVKDIGTDYGIQFKGNGGVERFDNGVGTNLNSLTANPSQQHVKLDFSFVSFADNQSVNAKVYVESVMVDDYNFTWDGNSNLKSYS